MQRPGRLRYEVVAGRFRPDSSVKGDDPLFNQTTFIYGINNRITLFGGVIAAENYLAGNAGIGTTLGDIGAFSSDLTWAKSHPDSRDASSGVSLRLLYSGKIDSTDTSFTLAGYRYSTEGYYSFADTNQHYDDDRWSSQYNKRNRLQLSISQSVLGNSIYLSGYQQDYWHSGNKERSLSAGINGSLGSISAHLSWTYSKTSDSSSDSMVSLGFSVPLSQWLPKSWASYNVSHSQQGNTSQSVALTGTLLDDDRLGYSLQQSSDSQGNSYNSSLYGSYRSSVSNLSAGYYYASDGSTQISYGASGGIVAHPHGVTLSQPLGDQFAIVNANGAKGVHFQNRRGIATDLFGNAVIPSLTAYQENTLRVDTASLPENVDTGNTAITLIPSHGAAVSATVRAQTGYRVLVTLTRQNGKKVPFGAVASVDGTAQSGIVDDTGTLYLAGIGDRVHLTVYWGDQAEQQCGATLQPSLPADNPAGIRKQELQCLQEIHHES